MGLDWAGNTPFRRWKRETYRGGISDPFIVQWTNGHQGQGRGADQYAHAIDMVPTVLDALGIEAPGRSAESPNHQSRGVSFAHTFDDADGSLEACHPVLRDDRPPLDLPRRLASGLPWPGTSFTESGRQFGTPIPAETLTELDATAWELYHVAEDVAENHDLAGRQPRAAASR